jgi:hypothetical protein
MKLKKNGNLQAINKGPSAVLNGLNEYNLTFD